MGIAELKSRAMLVSLRPGVRCRSGSGSNVVVLKDRGIDVEIVVSSTEEAVPIGYMTLENSEWTGTEECSSCPELVASTVER